MKNKRDSRRAFFLNIVFPSAFAVILFIGTLFWMVIPSFENAMMDRKREMIKQLTLAASSILDKYHKDELDGVLTREEAQQTAISRIRYLRYGDENKDYFWITDMKPVMIAHPYRPELNGQDLSDYEDSHGKKLFVASVETVTKSGQGFIEYMWQWKDDSTLIVPKLSYVKGFQPWGWIIGTGIYIDDVKSEIAGLTRKLITISLAISLIVALLLFYTGRQSFRIEGKRLKAEEELHQSREKYRSLVEASTEGLIMYMDGKISFVNAVFEKMTGIGSEDIVDKEVTEILEIPGDISEKISMGRFDFKQVTIESKLKSGLLQAPLDVVVNIVPIIFYGRQAVIFSLRDASSDKQIKEELFYNREKFKSLMDKLNMGIFRTSLDLKGKLLEINETGLKTLGFKSFDEISDVYILDFFLENEDKRTFRNNLLEKGFIKNKVLKLKRKSGEPAIVSVSLAVVYDNGQPRYCDGLIEDISVRRSFEQNESAINVGFTSFAQLLYQPVANFSQPVIFCDYNMTVLQVANSMTTAGRQYALVTAGGGEVLGFITDEIIRVAQGSFGEEILKKRAFEIMNAPVPSVLSGDMLLEASLFMKRKNIRFAAIRDDNGGYTGYAGETDLVVVQNFLPFQLLSSVESAGSAAELKKIRVEYVNSLIPIIDVSTHPSVVFRNLSLLADSISARIIRLAVDMTGRPPLPFAFINMGSEGRKEQTLKTDQDNAIIYADPDPEIKEEAEAYFNKLGNIISGFLDEAGYTFCKGGVMAMNPDWCKPLSVWKNYFKKWINNGKAQDLLDLCIFFDFRFTYGEQELADQLRSYVTEQSKKNPAYLYHLAQNTFNLKPQVGFWGNILLETAGAPPETVDIKKTIMPIVNFARIYALQNGLPNLNTVERLQALRDNGLMQASVTDDIIHACDYLATIRLKRQATLLKSNVTPDNLINTKNIGEFDQTIVKKVLSIINNMLSKLSYDFKGSV